MIRLDKICQNYVSNFFKIGDEVEVHPNSSWTVASVKKGERYKVVDIIPDSYNKFIIKNIKGGKSFGFLVPEAFRKVSDEA